MKLTLHNQTPTPYHTNAQRVSQTNNTLYSNIKHTIPNNPITHHNKNHASRSHNKDHTYLQHPQQYTSCQLQPTKHQNKNHHRRRCIGTALQNRGRRRDHPSTLSSEIIWNNSSPNTGETISGPHKESNHTAQSSQASLT